MLEVAREEFWQVLSYRIVSYEIAKLQDEKLLSFELQYRNVEKLQIAR